jgi:hypothetical protein
LQELGWTTELVALMKSKQSEIESSGDYSLLAEMYRVFGDKERYVDLEKKITQGMKMVDLGGEPIISFPLQDEDKKDN